MSQNGQIHFENFQKNPVKFLNVSDVFRKLCINPIRDGPFCGLLMDGGIEEAPSLKPVIHTLQ